MVPLIRNHGAEILNCHGSLRKVLFLGVKDCFVHGVWCEFCQAYWFRLLSVRCVWNLVLRLMWTQKLSMKFISLMS